MVVEYYVPHKIVSGIRFHIVTTYKGIKSGVYTLINPFSVWLPNMIVELFGPRDMLE